MQRIGHEVARFYEQVRTAHLERSRDLVPAAIVYAGVRYDFDPSLVGESELVNAGRLKAAWLILISPLRAIEVNEPLFLESLTRTALVVWAARARSTVTRRHVSIGTYAIENLDRFALREVGAKRALRRQVRLCIARYVWRRIDRVAFGTADAEKTYLERFGSPSAAKLILALPAPATYLEIEKAPTSVLFLGALTLRKGFDLLLSAWPTVVAERPHARLQIIGTGELAHDALRMAAAIPSVATQIDPDRARIHEALAEAAVLVLPSQPIRGWREQVGLPIVEGLSFGCRVVTTRETGLADWLAQNGHVVLDAPTTPQDLAKGIVRCIDASGPRQDILSSLPLLDGRVAADQWLFAQDGRQHVSW